MKIKVGDKFRDYMNVLYEVKEYENKIITFKVDEGNMKDEVYKKSDFISEINGNRFHIPNKKNKI